MEDEYTVRDCPYCYQAHTHIDDCELGPRGLVKSGPNVHQVRLVNWTRHLTDILDKAQEGDIVVVHTDAMLDLAKNALSRREEHKWLRLMTQDTYAEITEQH